MREALYGRSPVEIAEDRICEMLLPVFNVSMQEAARSQIQREEIAGPIREKAADLMDAWQGTPQQCAEAHALYLPWEFLTRAFRKH